MTKRIAFGTTLLNRGLSGTGIDGIGYYCQELLAQSKALNSKYQFCSYAFGSAANSNTTQALPSYPQYLIRESFFSAFSSPARQFFETVDLVHATDQFIPMIRNKPLIATIMDSIPFSHPQFLRPTSRVLKPHLWKHLISRANRLITISEYSKKEIIRCIDYPENQISVIPLGVDDRFYERIDRDIINQELKQLTIHQPFFLFIGSIQPRKNLLNTLLAHAKLPHDLATKYPIVIAGKLAWKDHETLKAIYQAIDAKRCIWLGYISDYQKRILLQSSLALLFISYYEGFGLPILEAFASQTPVITSNQTALPEVASDAALVVSPNNQHEITECLKSIINSSALRQELIHKGRERVKRYTWEATFTDTEKIYNQF